MTVLMMALVAASAGATGVVPGNDPPVDEGTAFTLRAFGGFGSGLGAEAWLVGGLIRLDADLEVIWPGQVEWAGLSAVVPLAGARRRFLALRAGAQLEYTAGHVDGGWTGSRFAKAADVGLVAHLESPQGSAVEVALGGEGVFRDTRSICCDDAALRTRSFGVRASLRGDLALSHSWGLFAEAGLRTADHLTEIKMLPTLAAGVRLRF